MTLQKAMTDFLGPGKTLSWLVADEVLRRLDHESGSTSGSKIETPTQAGDRGDTNVLHYDIIRMAGPKSKMNNAIRRDVKEKGGYRVFFRPNSELALGPGHTHLSITYKILADPRTAARYPVRFHISPPKQQKGPHSVEWALHNRTDLRPEVILRAMPSGSRHTKFVHIRGDGADAFFTNIVAKRYFPQIPDPRKDKVQPDLPGKADRTQAATDTQARPSPELQMKFERAVERKMQKATASIHDNLEKSLEKVVRRRLKKLNGGPTTPLLEEILIMERRKRVLTEQAIPRVWEHVARGFGIKIEPTVVAEGDPVDGSDGVPSPPMTSSTSS